MSFWEEGTGRRHGEALALCELGWLGLRDDAARLGGRLRRRRRRDTEDGWNRCGRGRECAGSVGLGRGAEESRPQVGRLASDRETMEVMVEEECLTCGGMS